MAGDFILLKGKFTPEWGDLLYHGKEEWELLKADQTNIGKFLKHNGVFAAPSWAPAVSDPDLSQIAALTPAQGEILYHNGTAWVLLAPGTSGQLLKTNGAAANPSWVTPSGGGRSDATPTSVNSASASIDVATSQTVIMTMTANVTNIVPTVDPTVDGTRLTIIFIRGGTAYTATLSATKFESGLDVTIPSPLLNTTINTRDIFNFIWNATTGKFSCVGFSRRY